MKTTPSTKQVRSRISRRSSRAGKHHPARKKHSFALSSSLIRRFAPAFRQILWLLTNLEERISHLKIHEQVLHEIRALRDSIADDLLRETGLSHLTFIPNHPQENPDKSLSSFNARVDSAFGRGPSRKESEGIKGVRNHEKKKE